jgi:hypothetical protein
MSEEIGLVEGRRDFDFLVGTWKVRNLMLRSRRPGAHADWVEFDSEVESRPVLGGFGNVDTYFAARREHGQFHGLAVRLYDPATGLWRIWWASNVSPGTLDPPLEGRFTDGEGHFEGDDQVDGKVVRVRFRWSDITPTSARWEQSFSFDGGVTFESNWVIQLTRTG